MFVDETSAIDTTILFIRAGAGDGGLTVAIRGTHDRIEKRNTDARCPFANVSIADGYTVFQTICNAWGKNVGTVKASCALNLVVVQPL